MSPPLAVHISPSLWKASLRHALAYPWQFGLALTGVALGVAVIVAVDIAIGSASRAFEIANDAVVGRATHEIVGGPGGVPESVYVALRRTHPEWSFAPVVEAYVANVANIATADEPSRTLHLLGVDPFAEAPFRSHLRVSASAGWLLDVLTRPGAAVLTRDAARQLGINVGDDLPIQVAGRRVRLELVGLLTPSGALEREALAGVVIVDIATAQEVLERTGTLTRIDLRPRQDAAEVGALTSALPAGLRLQSAGQGPRLAAQMTNAFELNLTMLSALALLVGAFLIYNTMAFAVVRRRGLIGVMRVLGVTRAGIFALVLTEALVVVTIAGGLGLAVGIWLSRGLLQLVTRTLNDHYLVVSVASVQLDPLVLVKGPLLAILAGLAAAAVPAWEASRVSPGVALRRSAVEIRTRQAVPVAVAAGVACLLLSASLVALDSANLSIGFAALFALVAGFALIAPGATWGMLWLGQPIMRVFGGTLGPIAARSAAASLSRTSVAVAALMVALAATVGVGVMVDSFRRTVVTWLDTTLQADFYVGVPGRGPHRALPTDLADAIAKIPGVEELSLGRAVEVSTENGPLSLLVLRLAAESRDGFHLLEGEGSSVWPAFEFGGAVLVSEPLAWRQGLHPGDGIALQTDRGLRTFPVAGVHRDYQSGRGSVVMARSTYRRFWADDTVTGIGVYVRPGSDLDRIKSAVQAELPSNQHVVLRSTGKIKQASLEIFDRTFTITEVLRLLATVVAFFGVLSALMALSLERAREVAILRAQGATVMEVYVLVQTQTGVLGLIAGLLALPLGLALALVLILVINRRSFGWGMDIHIDPMILLQALGIAVGAALLAGLYPAVRMARTSPAEALRLE